MSILNFISKKKHSVLLRGIEKRVHSNQQIKHKLATKTKSGYKPKIGNFNAQKYTYFPEYTHARINEIATLISLEKWREPRHLLL